MLRWRKSNEIPATTMAYIGSGLKIRKKVTPPNADDLWQYNKHVEDPIVIPIFSGSTELESMA